MAGDIHPFLAHFPLGLGLVYLWLGLVRRDFVPPWRLALLAILSLAAWTMVLFFPGQIETPEFAREKRSWHEILGWCLAILGSLLSLWRIRRVKMPAPTGALIRLGEGLADLILLILLVALMITGHGLTFSFLTGL